MIFSLALNELKTWKFWTILTLGTITYFLSARLGIELATINKQASPVWPATGVAISLCLIFGPRLLFSVFIGAFLFNFQTGLNWFPAICVAFGNALEASIFIYGYSKIDKFEGLYGIHSKAIFTILILIFATSASATIGTTTLLASHIISSHQISENWLTWWIGDFLGAIYIVPISYALKVYDWKKFKIKFDQVFKLIFLLILTGFLGKYIFLSQQGSAYLFLIFVILFLAAYWFKHYLWVFIFSLLVSVLSIWGASQGYGPFSDLNLNNRLIHLQIFLISFGTTAIGLASLKQEKLSLRALSTLVLGWMMSGMTFYYTYNAALEKELTQFEKQVEHVKKSIEIQMRDYVQVLESGVGFFKASDHVSPKDWKIFSHRLLQTNFYPGIEGIGVIFSDQIITKFTKSNKDSKYQPNLPTHNVPNVNTLDSYGAEKFIITYIEPLDKNKKAQGLNVASEKNRYEAAIKARDSGKPSITGQIQLVQDQKSRTGMLLYVPLYSTHNETNETSSIQERKSTHLGFIYAPLILENFMSTIGSGLGVDVHLKLSSIDEPNNILYSSGGEHKNKKLNLLFNIHLVDKIFLANFYPGEKFHSVISVTSSWIGFFGTILSLFFAILMSSLENLTSQAQKIAKEMTNKLELSKQDWKTLTENSPVGIFKIDVNNKCIYVNPTWTKMTGLDFEKSKDDGWLSILHPEDKQQFLSKWNMLNSGIEFQMNFRIQGQDRIKLMVAVHAVPILNESSKIVEYYGTIQDINELHNHQIALMNSSRMSSLGEMASGIAHEINTPLAIIQGRAYRIGMLLNDSKNLNHQEVKKDLQLIATTVQKIAKIIKGLRSFARESSAEPFELCSLRETIDESLELCRERFLNNNIQLIAPEKNIDNFKFLGRSEQISQILLNLLNNAFDAVFGKSNAWVKIEVLNIDNLIKIIVSDSGTGIAQEVQGRIFNPFYTTKEIGKGTGLGLSISKGIAERHGGKLYLDTTQIHTTFVLELPIGKVN